MLSLEWQHINLENKVLTIVHDRTKSGQTRHIPHNNEAYNALLNLKALTGSVGYLFKDKNHLVLVE